MPNAARERQQGVTAHRPGDFSELPRVFARLRELGKPFVVIMPCSTLTTRYFRDLFQDIQVIVPRRRIQFRKLVDGVEVPSGRLPVFLLATRVAEGCGVLNAMAVSTLPSGMKPR